MQHTAIITGATSGIGEACAIKFAANNYRLIIAGRRTAMLEKLAAQLKQNYATEVLALPLDVSDRSAVLNAIYNLPEEWKSIDVLINNAGLAAGKDGFADADLDDWDTMVDTNLKGAAYVAQSVAKLMIPNGRGHIINIGSTAGKEVYAQGNMYCATKHAVVALSEAMRIDLLAYNIKVTAINPGAVETAFSKVRFKGDEQAAAKVYEGLKPLSGADVAEVAYYCATLPPHVCINDLVLTCTQQANSFYYHRSS